MSPDEKPRRSVVIDYLAKVGGLDDVEKMKARLAELAERPRVSTPELYIPHPDPVPSPGRSTAKRSGRPRGRVVTLGRIARAHHELSLEHDKRPSQADVAVYLHEALRNVERALSDDPDFWDSLSWPI